MENLKNLWENIETQIKNILPEYANKELFEPGASEEEIKNFEKLLGTTLPQDFRESLKIHNGQALKKFILYDGRDSFILLSIPQIISNLKDKNNLKEDMEKDNYPLPKLEGIPVFIFPTGEYTLLNLQTGELGFFTYDESSGVGFKNFGVFLKKTLERLESGRYKNNDGLLRSLYIKNAWNLIDSIAEIGNELFAKSSRYDISNKFENLFPEFSLIETNELFRITYTQCHDGQKTTKPWFFDGTESYIFLNTEKIFTEFQPLLVSESILVPIFANQTSFIYINITENKYNTCSLYKKHTEFDTLELLEDDLIDILLKTYTKLKLDCGIDPKYK